MPAWISSCLQQTQPKLRQNSAKTQTRIRGTEGEKTILGDPLALHSPGHKHQTHFHPISAKIAWMATWPGFAR